MVFGEPFRSLFHCGQRSFIRLRLRLFCQKIHQHYGGVQITNQGEQLVIVAMALNPFPPPEKLDPARPANLTALFCRPTLGSFGKYDLFALGLLGPTAFLAPKKGPSINLADRKPF